MRKILLLLTFLTVASAVPASAIGFGIGGYGGMQIPIIQEDQSSGTAFGIKAKFGLVPGIAFEPNLNFAKYGDAEFEFGTRKGSKVTSYGVDAVLGSGIGAVGFRLYGILGGGFYSIKRDYDDDVSKFGWSTGMGFEIGFTPSFGIDIRGKINVISMDGGGTKKAAAVTGGINYYFGI